MILGLTAPKLCPIDGWSISSARHAPAVLIVIQIERDDNLDIRGNVSADRNDTDSTQNNRILVN